MMRWLSTNLWVLANFYAFNVKAIYDKIMQKIKEAMIDDSDLSKEASELLDNYADNNQSSVSNSKLNINKSPSFNRAVTKMHSNRDSYHHSSSNSKGDFKILEIKTLKESNGSNKSYSN